MKTAMDWLKGKKTYFVLGFAAVVWFLESAMIIPIGSLDTVMPGLVIAGGTTVAAKMQRLAS